MGPQATVTVALDKLGDKVIDVMKDSFDSLLDTARARWEKDTTTTTSKEEDIQGVREQIIGPSLSTSTRFFLAPAH